MSSVKVFPIHSVFQENLIFRIMNYLMPRKNIVPAFQSKWYRMTAGQYLNKLTQSHYKDRVRRKSVNDFNLVAGVNRSISLNAVDIRSAKGFKQTFSIDPSAEGCDFRVRFQEYGLNSKFVKYAALHRLAGKNFRRERLKPVIRRESSFISEFPIAGNTIMNPADIPRIQQQEREQLGLQQPGFDNAKEKHLIGVLIPAYNEEPVLKGTIDALVDAGMELQHIYVVDDRSTDRTAEIAFELGINIYTVPVNGGKARAQVQALAHFQLNERYEWLAFLDGDTKVDRGFFQEMIKAIKFQPGVALFLGQVKSVQNCNLFSASRAFDYTYGQDVAKVGQHKFNVVFVAPGCASLYRTDVLKRLKINHMTLAEDMDLTMQVHRSGHRVSYVASAFVNTQDPATFKDYHKQTLRWYRGFWQVTRIHKIFNPFTRKQRVDWYMIMLSADAILFNRVFWLGVLVYVIDWSAGALALGIDIATAGAISFYAAYRTKRWDVITKFPLYYWINYVNFYAYTRAFAEIVIFRKELLAWNKVARYNFDDDKPRQLNIAGT